jgi:hypothetical protein
MILKEMKQMTKATIHPGICNSITQVEASSEDQMDVTITIRSDCKAVAEMAEALGNEFDAFEVCLKRPGANLFYEYASKHFPGHAGCPVISGIVKCTEVECRLALPQKTEIIIEAHAGK